MTDTKHCTSHRMTFLPNFEGQKDSMSMLMAFFAFSNWSEGMLPESSRTKTMSLFAKVLSSLFPTIFCQG